MLASADLPSSVTSIGDRAFAGCSTLGACGLCEGLRFIGNYAFSSCDSLTNVTIPASVTRVGSDVFQNCRKLESISFEYDNPIEVSVHVRTATARFFTSKFVIEVVYSLEDDEVADVTGKVWKKK